jgi:hypothetical protein
MKLMEWMKVQMELTVTQDNKDKIKKITTEHFAQFPVLQIVDTDLNNKVEIIYNELPNIYKKLSEEKVLPEGCNLDMFMRTVLPRLQEEAQHAHIQKVFGI